MNPRAASGWRSRSAIRPIITSSDTSAPVSMMRLASRPSGVPAATASRSISPVAICGICHSPASSRAWVPLPAPGGPRKISRTRQLLRAKAPERVLERLRKPS